MKKEESKKSKVALEKISKEFDILHKDVNSKKKKQYYYHANSGQPAGDLTKCMIDHCIYRFNKSDHCKWLEEIGCTFKCNGSVTSIKSLKVVDINKFKASFSKIDSKSLYKKIKQYMPFAEKINELLKEQEEEMKIKKRKEFIARRLEELKEIDKNKKEEKIVEETEPKYKKRNLKSLI
jgi:hypothetical protein